MFDRLDRDEYRDDITRYIEQLADDELGRSLALRSVAVPMAQDAYVDPFDQVDDEQSCGKRTA